MPTPTPIPDLTAMARVSSDVKRCIDFVRRQPWGKPADREHDIDVAIEKIREFPRRCRVTVRRRWRGVELRRFGAAQFVIVYAYFRPSARFPEGLVSIRAVRHRRERNVFAGVREPDPPPYIAALRGRE